MSALVGVCYSGYREGQSPDRGIHPSEEQILEDLLLLAPRFPLLRLYDCGPAEEATLAVMRREGLPMKAMLGAWIAAEEQNPKCPWGGVYDEAVLRENRARNEARVEGVAALAARYPELVHSVSVGNEATVEWTDHLVPPARVAELARALKRRVSAPVTFCENWLAWSDGPREMEAIAEAVDFVSLHTYPLWEGVPIARAIDHTDENYRRVAARYPGKPLCVTEAGWTTRGSGRGMPEGHATEAAQARYCADLVEWSRRRGVLTFLFEAFDEPWKGSADPDEPEKHWGLYRVDRSEKPVVAALDGERAARG